MKKTARKSSITKNFSRIESSLETSRVLN